MTCHTLNHWALPCLRTPTPSHLLPFGLLRISRDETARLRPHVGLVVEVWDSFDQVYGEGRSLGSKPGVMTGATLD